MKVRIRQYNSGHLAGTSRYVELLEFLMLFQLCLIGNQIIRTSISSSSKLFQYGLYFECNFQHHCFQQVDKEYTNRLHQMTMASTKNSKLLLHLPIQFHIKNYVFQFSFTLAMSSFANSHAFTKKIKKSLTQCLQLNQKLHC